MLITERFGALSLLPKETDFVTLKVVRDLQDTLALSEKELKEYDVKTVVSKIDGQPRTQWSVEAAKKEAGRAWYLVEVTVPEAGRPVTAETFHYRLKRDKLRTVMKREGRYLLRAFVPEPMPAPEIWRQYIGLTEVEESFRNLKGDLGIRPIYHQKEERIEAHIFISFLSYCLHVALRGKLRCLAGGLTPRAALKKFGSMQMIDVHLPVGEGGEDGELVMPRYTRPDKDLALLLERMALQLPAQPPPTIRKSVGETF